MQEQIDYTKLFLRGMEKNPVFQEGVDIVRSNVEGRIWLIGGAVYRTIAHELHGSPKPEVDLDFIVERERSEFNLPGGWSVQTNRHGNPKFVNGKRSIDYIPLEKITSLQRRQCAPTIENYLVGVPLTVQSIAYAVDTKEVIGEIGKRAIRQGIVEIQDPVEAEYAAAKKGMTLRAFIEEKARSLEFVGL